MKRVETDRTQLAMKNLNSIKDILKFARLKLNDTLSEEILPTGDFDEERELVKGMHDRINLEIESNIVDIEEFLKLKSHIESEYKQ